MTDIIIPLTFEDEHNLTINKILDLVEANTPNGLPIN